MAQKTTLAPSALPGQMYTFTAKTATNTDNLDVAASDTAAFILTATDAATFTLAVSDRTRG